MDWLKALHLFIVIYICLNFLISFIAQITVLKEIKTINLTLQTILASIVLALYIVFYG